VNLLRDSLEIAFFLLIFAENLYDMAIQYRLLQNKIKGSENYGKYYAHTVKQGTVSLEQIEEMIESNCTAKASDVRLVLRELFDVVKFYMQHGYTVDLREMGKLSISVKSVCVDDPKEFRSDKHITGFKCNYTPQGKRSQATGEENSRHIHRSILDGCEAAETNYY